MGAVALAGDECMQLTHAEYEAIQKRWKRKLALMPPREQLKYANSYTRMECLLRMADAPDFWELVGEHWSCCDNVWQSYAEVSCCLMGEGGTIRRAMNASELARFDALPNAVKVWRGAHEGINELGLSWSLSKSIAAKFPTLARYKCPGYKPVLVSGWVSKISILFLKLDREEDEAVLLPENLIRLTRRYLKVEAT